MGSPREVRRTVEETVELLRELCTRHAPPGGEEEVAGVLARFLEGYCDSLEVDLMGNLLVKVGKRGPRVMLAAHMDEVAMMVRWIDPSGFLAFTPLGGLDPRVLMGQRVVVHSDTGPLEGFIGAKPPHVTTPEEAKKAPELRELYIDIGASSREEAVAAGVRPGTYATFPQASPGSSGPGSWVRPSTTGPAAPSPPSLLGRPRGWGSGWRSTRPSRSRRRWGSGAPRPRSTPPRRATR
jgi:hypothetical protein